MGELWNINLGKYHDVYVQSDKLFLGHVFISFRNNCIKIYKLDPAYFLSTPGLAWKASVRKIEVELEMLRDVDILLW